MEVLIAIGIIATLAVLLVPSLDSMRNRSQQARCASNLRQIGSALLQYAGRTTAHCRRAHLGPRDLPYFGHCRLEREGARTSVLTCPMDKRTGPLASGKYRAPTHPARSSRRPDARRLWRHRQLHLSAAPRHHPPGVDDHDLRILRRLHRQDDQQRAVHAGLRLHRRVPIHRLPAASRERELLSRQRIQLPFRRWSRGGHAPRCRLHPANNYWRATTTP